MRSLRVKLSQYLFVNGKSRISSLSKKLHNYSSIKTLTSSFSTCTLTKLRAQTRDKGSARHAIPLFPSVNLPPSFLSSINATLKSHRDDAVKQSITRLIKLLQCSKPTEFLQTIFSPKAQLNRSSGPIESSSYQSSGDSDFRLFRNPFQRRENGQRSSNDAPKNDWYDFDFFYNNEIILDESMKLALWTVLLCFLGVFLHNNLSTPWVVQNLYGKPTDFQEGRFWTYFTHWIFHSNISHFFFNCIILIPCAPIVADILGSIHHDPHRSLTSHPSPTSLRTRYILFIAASAFVALSYQHLRDALFLRELFTRRLPQPAPESYALPSIGASGVALSFLGFVLSFCAPRSFYSFTVGSSPRVQNSVVHVNEHDGASTTRRGHPRTRKVPTYVVNTVQGDVRPPRTVNIRGWHLAALVFLYFQAQVRAHDRKEYNAARDRARYGRPRGQYAMDLTQHACHLGGLVFGITVGGLLALFTRFRQSKTAYHHIIAYAMRSRFRPRTGPKGYWW